MPEARPIEVRKIAYRQSAKDGLVITFAVHPNDMPPALAAAPIGTRFAAALVEIGDDEQPIPSKTRQQLEASVEQERKKPNPLAQRVAITCNEPSFRKFLAELDRASPIAMFDVDGAAEIVREHCGVSSRKEILPGTEAARKWDELHAKFLMWSRG